MRFVLIFAVCSLVSSASTAQTTWDVGRRSGEDATRALYIYEGNAGDAPLLRMDCTSGSRLRISHTMESRGVFRRMNNLTLNVSAGSETIQITGKTELDDMTGLTIVNHLANPGSDFIRLLRTNSGTLRIGSGNQSLKPITIDLAGNRAKVDQALAQCAKGR
jgi:hypothetical protein